MSTFLQAIGLRASSPATMIPNYAPSFVIFQFIFAYGVLSSRTLKQYYGLDHNASPREDLKKYGDVAVREGKITQKQLDMLKRNEAAHANAVENFTLFTASVLFASLAGVKNQSINAAASVYTVARICYGVIYILIDHPLLSQLRGITWWTGNISCLYLLWQAGNKLNTV